MKGGVQRYLILLSVDYPDSATYLTFWSSEEAMVKSLKGATENVHEALGDLVEGRAVMGHNETKELMGVNKVLPPDIGWDNGLDPRSSFHGLGRSSPYRDRLMERMRVSGNATGL